MLEPPGLQHLFELLHRRQSNDPRDPDVRLVVRARARDACEYCLMPTISQAHVDHIVPENRWSAFVARSLPIKPEGGEQGPNHLGNFAWTCPYCNTSKGNAISGVLGGQTYPLFHPRRDPWSEHFALTDRSLFIPGLTQIGQVTEDVLKFNDRRSNGPLAARHIAVIEGIYPPSWARGWSI